MFIYKPRYAFSDWTPPPFNTIESGYVVTIPDGTFAISVLPDKRHIMRVGANGTSPSIPNYVTVFDTHNYSNVGSRIPVEAGTRTIRAAMHPQRSKFCAYKNYYAVCSDTALDQQTMQFEVGFFNGTTFVTSMLTLAQFWTPARPADAPTPNAGEFQSYIPYIFECGGKVFCAVRYVYTFNYASQTPKPTYSVFRVFDITNGTATYVQDLAYSIGPHPAASYTNGTQGAFANQYYVQGQGNVLVMSTYFAGNLTLLPNYYRNYIQTYNYNGTSFVPAYGEYSRLTPSTFVLVSNINGNTASLHKGSWYGNVPVNSMLNYNHGPSTGAEVSNYPYSNQLGYDMDRESGFMYDTREDATAIDIKRLNSDYSLTTVSSVTAAQIDALDPGMFGATCQVFANGSYMLHDGAILALGGGLLAGRRKLALVVGA